MARGDTADLLLEYQANDANSMAAAAPSTAAISALQPSLNARLNNCFFVIRSHHDDLAAKVTRQRMRKIVYPVNFITQIG
jgi:hypothetical protein